ncbi:alanine--tRNA ligase [Brackiella oedipodis]|uniref:alanine--tRNA ligase n=1 Tax=Brackiella oedipodis TaxID=124225 RepID=UPI00048C6F13|nr:alanine--tRNA ligase [Brackiella oedipodis]
MKSAEIRQKFLNFFEEKGHTVVPSSSLIPSNDPTLLFTNAGMVQFKDVFTGKESRDYKRAVTSQRCLRAGGKHNDLENVGYTARHHTFFEMLGNFSFGDYFKQQAISYCWELLTQVYKLPPEKLWVTVYQEDDEAYNIWKDQIQVPAERIIRIGDNKGSRYASDNFWQMGDTGPCGPCSEVFYDHGPEVWGGPPGSAEEDGDRYIEIWNLVFMQFERSADGTMTPLPRPCVDTGMGLERISAVMQHVRSNYDIDLFQHLIRAAAELTHTQDLSNNSLKVIADHIRACSFMIVDGVIPGNEGRGYVLRRIIRRALRHGYRLGQNQSFFYKLVPALVAEMGSAYPELAKQQERVAQVLLQEEERFQNTLEKGMQILEQALQELPKGQPLNGETVFTLYDTFGFPFDLTADICREHDVQVDEAGFNQAMQKQREMARASGKFKATQNLSYSGADTDFQGYEHYQSQAKVLALYHEGVAVQQLSEGQEGVVVLDHTPFYAESGGQVGDAGTLQSLSGQFDVYDVQKIQTKVFGHYGTVTLGALKVGDELDARIDIERRQATARNHSVTHLMHKALRLVLGDHVQQKGSLVDADKTRFDFSHEGPLTERQIEEVEAIVNREILKNEPTSTRVIAYDEALESGATALFGEKYGDQVRVVDIGFSRELCGGTHVHNTGAIGLFKIASQSGVAAGIRRVEGITGMTSLAWVHQLNRLVLNTADILKTSVPNVLDKTKQQNDYVRDLEKQLRQLQDKLAAADSADLANQASEIAGVKVLAKELKGVDPKTLRTMIDGLKQQLKQAVIVLMTTNAGKVSVAAGVTTDTVPQVKAGELVAMVCAQLGGKGGGRPDMAMGGGSKVEALPQALASVPEWLKTKLTQ